MHKLLRTFRFWSKLVYEGNVQAQNGNVSPRVHLWLMFTCLFFCVCVTSGGYYLTSAYGAMALIKNFQEEQAAQVLSSEARNTLHQWHRRRTAQRSVPSVDDFQVSRLTWAHLDRPGSESKSCQFHINPALSIGAVHERCSVAALLLKLNPATNLAPFTDGSGVGAQVTQVI